MATAVKDGRLDLRLAGDQKREFQAAAASRGMTLTQWALSSLTGAARRDLEDAYTIHLSPSEFDAFAAALDAPLPEAASELLARGPVWGA